jgi:class 3 adenylate cyclase
MKCLGCGFENAAGMKFCGECGGALALKCRSCGFENPRGMKFCGECGNSLADPAAPARSPDPRSYTPRHLAEKILTSRSALEGERKQLTVLFCDLVGSTELSSRLDPEEWRETVRRYQDVAAGVIERHGGHVAQYLGDGLLVYFGYPRAHDDDAERAIRAGLGLVDAVGTLDCGTPLAVRVGIHTGTVVVGDMGGSRHETLALGETPNVAARLQALASPQTVVISHATFRLVPGLFVTEPLGPQELKGLSAPVEVHRVVQPSGVRSRLDVAAGRLTPFVGRALELATLVERLQRAADGEGQNVLVVVEAGVGKSRLVYELRARVAAVPHTWLECRATPYTEATPFYPVIELLKQGLDFPPEDTASEKLGKLERGLGRAHLALPEVVPMMAEFLSLAAPENHPPLEMHLETRRRKTSRALGGVEPGTGRGATSDRARRGSNPRPQKSRRLARSLCQRALSAWR